MKLRPACNPMVLVAATVALSACAHVGPNAAGAASGTRGVTPATPGCAAPAVNPGAPPARANGAFAFDIDRRQMVLFGGGYSATVGGDLNDTWTWDAGGWTQVQSQVSPPPTSYAAMAYDNTHHYMVLFVPSPAPATPPETWTWDGTGWTQQAPAHTPPTRGEPVMATDPSRGGVTLVGGTDASDRSDVWSWNGTDWTEVLADQGPVFGAAHALVVSPKDGSLIVIGNLGPYQFSGGAWTSLGVPWPASTGYVGNVAFDVGGAGEVGFVRFGPHGETWSWLPTRDSAWKQLAPACTPPARWAHTFRPEMAYDDWTDQIVLFGGRNLNDTWVFDGATWKPGAGDGAPAASPSPSGSSIAGSWASVTGLLQPRLDHTATVLRDGRVLVVGGSDEAEIHQFASAEIFDPRTNAWTQAGAMQFPRARHTATLLQDGRVLVAGGLGPGRGNAEIFDPATNSWSSAGNLNQARANHAAVLLGDGTVLVIGGRQPGRPLASAEIFDPRAGTWSMVGSLSLPRDRPQAAVLPDGRVLVTGGVTIDTGGSLDASVTVGHPLPDTEIYDPRTGTWSPGAPMSVGRVGHTMTSLGDGRVLVVGGTKDAAPAEIYDPRSGAWTQTAALLPRIAPAAGLLQNGRVIVAGGLLEQYDPATVASTGYTPVLLDTVEVFDPATGAWSTAPPLGDARWLATGSVLGDGRFLVCGGGNPLAAGTDFVEAFTT